MRDYTAPFSASSCYVDPEGKVVVDCYLQIAKELIEPDECSIVPCRHRTQSKQRGKITDLDCGPRIV